MNTIDKLFNETNDTAFYKFENQDFENSGEVHDWKNYVPDEIIECWNELTEREKKLIFILTEPNQRKYGI